ncbi:MAG: RluA family pseudouridine synthase [Alphaproteobacteria bacterium]|nr:RluA family pseudouridine synthase [Alphaproteobacteria bacterium]
MQYFNQQACDKGRIDKIVAQMSGLSRNYVQKLLQMGYVWHDDNAINAADYAVQIGDRLLWAVPDATKTELLPEKIPLDIHYEDDDLLVLDKQAFLCVHPAPSHEQGTLVNALLYHCGETLIGVGGELRPGIVHRLDKDTSGLLVVAKNHDTHQHLSAQFARHDVTRRYIAFVKKMKDTPKGRLEGYIGRHMVHRQKMALYNDANANNNKGHHGYKFAALDYAMQILYKNGAAKIECKLHTGRTHQIRVQMSAAGMPLIGDKTYGAHINMKGGNADIVLPRQALHAVHLGFQHPKKDEFMCFDSALPHDLQQLQAQLESF